jgi:CTP:molybdopterin cytidylyltransferase MocA
MFPMLTGLDGDRGAGALLEGGEQGPVGLRTETDDPGVLFDVDTREDLQPGH